MPQEAAVRPDDQYRIIIKSVGSARPATSAAIAKGLGLPTSTVISRLYRAPAVLVDGVDEKVARQMSTLLSEIGYQAEIQSCNEPAPESEQLFDVAIYIEDVERLSHAIKSVAEFVGMSEADAYGMITSPPGVILGSVTQATAEAFRELLGEGISVVRSVTATADYDLFVGEAPEIAKRRLLSDIEAQGLPLLSETGLVAAGASHEAATELWRKHQSGGLRVVNRDFLRFDLVCTGNSRETITSEQAELLHDIAGIPADMVEEVLNNLPITLMEAVTNADVEPHMRAMETAGLSIRADLITFQTIGLEILSTSDAAATQQALTGLGLLEPHAPLPHLPHTVEGVMPELQARVVKAALEESGAEIEFLDPAAEEARA